MTDVDLGQMVTYRDGVLVDAATGEPVRHEWPEWKVCENTLFAQPTRRELDRLHWHRPDLHERAVARRRKAKRGGPR